MIIHTNPVRQTGGRSVLVAGLDIRVLSQEGELLRHLTLDPTRSYQPLNP